MTLPGPIPAIDVIEADRRLHDDPDRPILLDVREVDEFHTVRAPDVLHIPMSTFQARLDVPTDRPVMVICHTGGRSAAVTGFLLRSGRGDVWRMSREGWRRGPRPACRPVPGQLDQGRGRAAGLTFVARGVAANSPRRPNRVSILVTCSCGRHVSSRRPGPGQGRPVATHGSTIRGRRSSSEGHRDEQMTRSAAHVTA